MGLEEPFPPHKAETDLIEGGVRPSGCRSLLRGHSLKWQAGPQGNPRKSLAGVPVTLGGKLRLGCQQNPGQCALLALTHAGPSHGLTVTR